MESALRERLAPQTYTTSRDTTQTLLLADFPYD